MVLVLEAHRASEGRGGGGCQGVAASIAVRCRGSIGWLKYWSEKTGQRIPVSARSCFSASTPSATTLAQGASSKVEGEADQPAVRDRNSQSLEVSCSSSPASAVTIGAACLIGGS
jgi:hypothetical protein